MSNGCGMFASFPIIVRSTPAQSCGTRGDALRRDLRATAGSRTTGSPSRSRSPTAPTATSIRSRRASLISGPGLSPPTVRTGWPIPSIGRNVTRGVEDRLSDALHERLTERFVDRRTSVLDAPAFGRTLSLEARIQQRPAMSSSRATSSEGSTGFVFVARSVVGRLGSEGVAERRTDRAQPARSPRAPRGLPTPDGRSVRACRRRSLRWTRRCGRQALCRAGESYVRASAYIGDEHLSGAPREWVETRLNVWLKSSISRSCSDH